MGSDTIGPGRALAARGPATHERPETGLLQGSEVSSPNWASPQVASILSLTHNPGW